MEVRTKGLFIFAITAGLYIYYFVWLFIMPFVDEDTLIQSYFPDRKYGYMLPTLILVLCVALVCAFVGLALINAGSVESKKNSTRARQQAIDIS